MLPQPALDHFARLLQRHLGKFLQIEEPVRLRHMPGGGGVQAAAWLERSAPRDASTLAILPGPFYRNRILSGQGQSLRFRAIGARSADEFVCAVLSRPERGQPLQPDAILRNLIKQTVIAGAATAAHASWLQARLIERAAPGSLRIIPGYRDFNDAVRALQREEITLLCGWSVEALRARGGAGQGLAGLTPLLRFTPPGMTSSLTGVPSAELFSADPSWREAAQFLAYEGLLGSVLIAPPGTPEEALAPLREAFVRTLRDAQVRREASRRSLALDPVSPARIETAFAAMNAVSAPARKLLQEIAARQAPR